MPDGARSESTIAVAPGQDVAVRMYGRRKTGETSPLVVHFHGGAFVSGDLDSGCTIAGLLLPTLLEGKPHDWAKEFDPKRVTLHPRELGTLARENADVALQFGDYVTPGQVEDEADGRA